MIKTDEFEHKFLLSKHEFLELIKETESRCFDVNPTKNMQINYYYDNDNFDLYSQNITLRIRQKGSVLVGQLKTHSSSLFYASSEEEFHVTTLPCILKYKAFETSLKGVLATERTSFGVANGVKIDFDKNYYLGVVDYEIEIEFAKERYDFVKRLIGRLKFNRNESANKYSRFVCKLKCIDEIKSI